VTATVCEPVAGGIPPATLAAYTDAELYEFYSGSAPDADDWRQLLEAEMERRDAADHARQARRADPVTCEWRDAAHAQYLAAEAACSGVLLNRRGIDAGIDPWQLWRGPQNIAGAYCSEELRNYWLDHPRVTVTGYRDQAAAQRKAYADEQLADHDTRPVRHDTAAGPDRAVPATRPVRDGRPGRPADRSGDKMNIIRDAERAARLARLHERAQQIRGQSGQQPATATGTVAVREPSAIVRQQPPVDGALVLGYARAFIDRYARMPSEAAADVVALWAMHAHCREAAGVLLFESTPRLMLLSAEPGSGKSRVLGLLRMLCGGRYGLLTEPTAWALAHITGPAHEAAFIDEADVLFGRGSRKESVRAVLNSGYARDGVIAHMRGKTVEDLATFGPVAMAGLDVMKTATGASLEPLFSRSITIRMRKSADPVPQLDRTAREAAAMLHTAMAAWAAQNRDELAGAIALPDWLANRDGEVWGPVLAVAAVAAGEWPDRAITAAAELCGGWEQPADDGADFMTGLADLTAGW
jgi:Protein of unknown function (DUF3631)